jgi:hypothetical protein
MEPNELPELQQPLTSWCIFSLNYLHGMVHRIFYPTHVRETSRLVTFGGNRAVKAHQFPRQQHNQGTFVRAQDGPEP